MKHACECGRMIEYRNFKAHLRHCTEALRALAKSGHNIKLLDERTEKQKREFPIEEPKSM